MIQIPECKKRHLEYRSLYKCQKFKTETSINAKFQSRKWPRQGKELTYCIDLKPQTPNQEFQISNGRESIESDRHIKPKLIP